MPTVIDGKALAAHTNATTRTLVEQLAARGRVPRLAIVLVGGHAASQVYVAAKQKAAAAIGIETRLLTLPETATTAAVLATLKTAAADKTIHGIIVQMPLPPQVDTNAVLAALPPAKDVDGLSPANLGALMAGAPGLVPATPQGCLLLVQSVRPALAGLHAVVLGRSRLVGKPMAHLLLAHDCTVTIAHSRSAQLQTICRSADVLVAATGRPGLIQRGWVKDGAVVIDVGITRHDGRLLGDVDPGAVANAAAFTPVPGGVGPMTIACLLANVVAACAKQHRITL